LLTMTDLKHAFANAMTKVKGYINTHRLICSTDVVFEGLSDNDKFAVEMWYTGKEHTFHVTFSRHYLNNKREKAEKMFFRYITTSNPDGTFKNYTQVKDELRKLPFETHYDVTYQNDYLVTDVTEPFNGVVCEKCHRSFRYEPGAKIFDNVSRFMCTCGGSLVAVINGVKQVHANTEDRYTTCDPHQLDNFRNVDFSPLADFSKEVQAKVNAAVLETGKLNAKTIRPLVTAAVADGDVEMLKAIDATFPVLYAHIYRKLQPDVRKKLCMLALPSNSDVLRDETKTTVTTVAKAPQVAFNLFDNTPYADNGELVQKLAATFFDDDARADSKQVTVQVVHEQVETVRVWSPEFTQAVAAIFFNEAQREQSASQVVEVVADGSTDDAQVIPHDVDWLSVAKVFFGEVDAQPSSETVVVVQPSEPEQASTSVAAVDWDAVGHVFFDTTQPAVQQQTGVDWHRVASVFFNAA